MECNRGTASNESIRPHTLVYNTRSSLSFHEYITTEKNGSTIIICCTFIHTCILHTQWRHNPCNVKVETRYAGKRIVEGVRESVYKRDRALDLQTTVNKTTRKILSNRTVQQMQPLFISKISSSASNFCCTKASSIPTSPYSFSMTAIFLPCC